MTPQDTQTATQWLEKFVHDFKSDMREDMKEIKGDMKDIKSYMRTKVDKSLFKWVIGIIMAILFAGYGFGIKWMLETTEKIAQAPTDTSQIR